MKQKSVRKAVAKKAEIRLKKFEPTKEVLEKLLEKWVTIFDLASPVWQKIEIDFGAEKSREGVYALIFWEIEHSKATMLISSPEYVEKTLEEPWTLRHLEETIIHELLHLRLEGHKLCGKRSYDASYERGINIISAILNESLGEQC